MIVRLLTEAPYYRPPVLVFVATRIGTELLAAMVLGAPRPLASVERLMESRKFGLPCRFRAGATWTHAPSTATWPRPTVRPPWRPFSTARCPSSSQPACLRGVWTSPMSPRYG